MRQVLPLLVLSLLLLSIGTNAQQKTVFNLKGTVIDSTANSAIQFATLTIAKKENPSSQVKAMATDEKGNFQVGLSDPGEYTLSVFYFGSKAAEIPFTIKASQKEVSLGTIYIAEERVLKEAVVVAQKPLVTVELDKLTYDTESDPDSKTETALEMLRKVPMVTVDGEDKIQLQGSTSFKVYVNGKPSATVTSNPSDVLKSMPASNIKSIEVITDPGAKYDAEGIGGIINIIMTKRTDDGYTATVGANAETHGGYGAYTYITLKQGKLGFSGSFNYNYWNKTGDKSELFRDNLINNSRLTQFGASSYKGPYNMGSGELSYEFDTLNMIMISVNHRYDKETENSTTKEKLLFENPPASANPYSFTRNTERTTNYGSTEVDANYQRSFKKKGVLLTTSYRYNYSPNHTKYETLLSDMVNSTPLWEHSKNEAASNEHTFQLDYVNPIKEKHNLEVGVKYIIRLNNSDPYFEKYDYTTNIWNRDNSRENEMDYRQDIISSYASYGYKMKKFGFKTGIRFEGSNTDVNYKTDTISSRITDIVPSAALSYQLEKSKTIRLNYGMRIQRPSIWHLNPYINRSNPTNISYGNPELDSENSHNISISYSSFTQKVNFNLSTSYTITNNPIQQYSFIDADTLKTTYGNIGKKQVVGFNFFANWTPVKYLKFMVNGRINYSDINSRSSLGNSNHGFGGGIYSNVTYTFLKSFRVGAYGGIFKQPVSMQGEMSLYKFVGFNVGKDFFDKKLSINVSIQDPFTKRRNHTIKTSGSNFYQESCYIEKRQGAYFRVSYKFGNLKNQEVKKVERGITNDDVMQGNSGNAK